MKRLSMYAMAAFLFVASACQKEEVKNQNVVAKESTTQASVENCNKGTISAGQQFYFMNNIFGPKPGWQCTWYNNINSWGVNAGHTGNDIQSYPAMVYGCHWGSCTSNTGLPKRVSSLGPVRTWWSQSSSGDSWDAAYDIWFDPAAYPGNRQARYELMIWLQWKNTKPLTERYDASGNAIPFARNVSVGGKTWNIYKGKNSTSDVFSFLLVSQSSWISLDTKPLIDYCVARGWMSSSVYMTSVQAGWEIIRGGNFSTSSFGVAGI